MNANELADLLEVDSWYKLVTREEIANTLRQQQAEIEALQQNNRHDLTDEKCYEVVFDGENYTTKLVEPRLKTLTDEEIAQAWAETKGDILHRLMPFARAILRKAQEK